MQHKKIIEIKGHDILAISSENYTSEEKGCLKFLDSFQVLDADMNKLSKLLTYFLTLDANGIKDELFRKKVAHQYEKFQIIESSYEPINIAINDFY